MKAPVRQVAALVSLWLLLVVVSLFSRSYIPIDETRYVTVAWNMWLRGDFLVPYLNGEAYSHKPPLLFWLMHLGWSVFGVNDWWPRLVPSFFSLASAWLTWRLAARLWPQAPHAAVLAPLILLGSLLWTVFSTATMFDMLVAFFTLWGMLGILMAWQEHSLRGWLILGGAIGGGLLAKGPTILLQLLPLALLAPWWGRGVARVWSRWYLGILGAVLLGVLIALIWAIPAGMRGGDTYQQAIFWGQTADRMVNSFAHKRAFLWYFPLLPIMFFPWLLWLALWRGGLRLREVRGELGVRFALAWLLPVFLAFCAISGKQMHYLLPLFPAFALLAARALTFSGQATRMDVLPVGLVTAVAGAALIYLPHYAGSHALAPWIGNIPVWGGVALIMGALLLALARPAGGLDGVWQMTLLSALVTLVLYIGVIRAAGPAYDVRSVSLKLRELQLAGVPLVHAGRYHGTFNFLGRLEFSPEYSTRDRLQSWFESHPDGRAIVYFNRSHPRDGVETEFIQHYQGDQIAIVNREQWLRWWTTHRTGGGEGR